MFVEFSDEVDVMDGVYDDDEYVSGVVMVEEIVVVGMMVYE